MGKPKRWFILSTLILVGMSWSHASGGNPPAGHPPPDDNPLYLLFTGHLNSDSHPDSVFGYADIHFNYLPRVIRWGMEDDRDKHMRETMITYPAWGKFSGSASFRRLNGDTLTDIILYLWGSVGEGREQHDTMRAIAIFGQKKLGKVATLHVEAIEAFQEKPFVAMELRVGTELVNRKSRDISGRSSYERLPVDLDVEDADTNERSAPLAGSPLPGMAGLPEHVMVRVYPNPSGTSVRIEGEEIPPGRYRVEMIAANGEISRREEIVVEASKQFVQHFDVQRLPNGHYIVRLLRDGVSFGSYPLIITR